MHNFTKQLFKHNNLPTFTYFLHDQQQIRMPLFNETKQLKYISQRFTNTYNSSFRMDKCQRAFYPQPQQKI